MPFSKPANSQEFESIFKNYEKNSTKYLNMNIF
jgi:hypothetical protein